MKTAISGFGLIVMLVIAVTCQSMVINYSARETELSSAVNSAMYETQKVLSENSESIRSDEDYVNVFMTNLLGEGGTNANYDADGNYKQNGYISSNSKISLVVYTADYENGFLDLAVTETYGYNKIDKSDRSITVRRSSIIEKFEEEKAPQPEHGTLAYISYNFVNDATFVTTSKIHTANDNKVVDNTYLDMPDKIDIDASDDYVIKIPYDSKFVAGNLKVSFETEAADTNTRITVTTEDVENIKEFDKVLVITVTEIEGNISFKIG